MDELKEYLPQIENLLKQGFSLSEEESNELLELLDEDKPIYKELLNSLQNNVNDDFNTADLFNPNSKGILLKLIEKVQCNSQFQEKIQEIFLKKALRQV